MKRALLQLPLAVGILLLVSFGAAAQTTAEKSRLYVGSKGNEKVTAKSQFSLPKTVESKPLTNTSILNKYYKETLISKSTLPKSASQPEAQKVAANQIQEKVVISNMYPNPADDHTNLVIKYQGKFTKARISFFNLIGAEVESIDLGRMDEEIRVSTVSWPSGVYFYQLLVDDKKLSTKKFVVSHN